MKTTEIYRFWWSFQTAVWLWTLQFEPESSFHTAWPIYRTIQKDMHTFKSIFGGIVCIISVWISQYAETNGSDISYSMLFPKHWIIYNVQKSLTFQKHSSKSKAHSITARDALKHPASSQTPLIRLLFHLPCNPIRLGFCAFFMFIESWSGLSGFATGPSDIRYHQFLPLLLFYNSSLLIANRTGTITFRMYQKDPKQTLHPDTTDFSMSLLMESHHSISLEHLLGLDYYQYYILTSIQH